MRRTSGFTLIELMVTVAVIAILAAIAIPSYADYVRRGRISEAVSTLASMRVKMEQYYQDNRSYVSACGTTGTTVAEKPPDTPTFVFTCPQHDLATYLIKATGQGTMQSFIYTIDQLNGRATTGVPPGWQQSTTCWVIRKDGSC